MAWRSGVMIDLTSVWGLLESPSKPEKAIRKFLNAKQDKTVKRNVES